MTADLDADLARRDRDSLIDEVRSLRAAIREHRDSTGHALCWHHPKLWSLLPEQVGPDIEVPNWPQFLRGCIAYRLSLDKQAAEAPRSDNDFEG